MTYPEITKALGVSKGHLSMWLSDYSRLTGAEIWKRRKNLDRKSTKKDRGEPSPLSKLTDMSKLTRFQKGRVAEAAALLRVSLFGMQAFHAFGDGSTEDIVVLVKDGVRHAKLQVKWAVNPGRFGLPYISLRHNVNASRKERRYAATDFDFIVGYDSHSDICYVFSSPELIVHNRSVAINPTAAEAWDQVVAFCRGESPQL